MKEKQDFIEKFIQGRYGGLVLPAIFLILGSLMIIGAIKNWNWLYEADIQYRSNWSLGKISRYIGRQPARIVGFCTGLVGVAAGLILGYPILMDVLNGK